MKHDKLKEKLSRLEKSMKDIDKTDVESKNRLSKIIKQIQLKLKDQSDVTVHYDTLSQLENAIVHFEVKHPAVTEILNEITTILVSLGI